MMWVLITGMFDAITIDLVFDFILVFCRLGSGIMMLPGLSERYISSKARLVMALLLAGLVTPVVQHTLPAVPNSAIMFVLLVTGEIIIGVLIGSIAKLVLSAMHIAGGIIAYQMGLASATLFDPNQGMQGAIIGVFFSMLALLLILTTDMHHVFLKGLVDSYVLFSPGAALPIAGFAELVTNTAADGFNVGMKIAAPQLVIGLLLYLGAGVMARLMPQMHVFFVIMPLQITLGFFIIAVTLSGSMMWFMEYYGEVMSNFME